MKKMNRYKCVIFDLDGTVLDTSEGIRRALYDTIEQQGFPKMSEEQMQSCIGPPVQLSLQRIYGLSEQQANAAAEVFRESYKNKYLFLAKEYEGIFKLLTQLRTKAVKVMIAIYKREDYTVTLLKQLGLYEQFDFVMGSDFEGKRTKAYIINQCIQQYGCKLNEAIMIGDTIHDSTAAEDTGIDFLAVTYGFGFHSKQDTKQTNAIYVASNPDEIASFFM